MSTTPQPTTNCCPDCGEALEIGMWPLPCAGRGHSLRGSFILNAPACHKSDRTVVDFNPRTGDIGIPGRADRPLHPKQIAMGIERREIEHATGRDGITLASLESKGLVHEPTTYRNGNGQPTAEITPRTHKSAAELGLLG